nr:hypothetical protein [uncultured Pseudomonas sp.]
MSYKRWRPFDTHRLHLAFAQTVAPAVEFRYQPNKQAAYSASSRHIQCA